MPSFGDSVVIFLLALILFGPKRLPEIARWVGKLMAEFRRASNEFRIQMEDELRIAEQAETQKKLAAIASPTAANADAAGAEPSSDADAASGEFTAANPDFTPAEAENPTPENLPLDTEHDQYEHSFGEGRYDTASYGTPVVEERVVEERVVEEPVEAARLEPAAAEASSETAVPIATAGELSIHPPSTGLPVPAHAATENKHD